MKKPKGKPKRWTQNFWIVTNKDGKPEGTYGNIKIPTLYTNCGIDALDRYRRNRWLRVRVVVSLLRQGRRAS